VRAEKKIARQIGARIRELREQRALSQEELADKARVDLSHLGKLERGDGNPTIELLVRLCTALDAKLTVTIESGTP
jgi:transcriptional regulator with XRE-family HTH domain